MTQSVLLTELAGSLEFGQPERCGVITAAGELLEIENIHTDPVKGFHMDPLSFLKAIEDGATATWHTHPAADPNLSEDDRQGFAQWPELTHHIVGIRDGEPTVHSFAFVNDILVTV
ncbi:hypothetical protein [Sphingomonas jaspsi]|uniref:hypothetical protein n=1 Tax=Sphingomonas jaspsi TaxID=392409 RepID=UPI0005622DE6|nr:hypothetical protein [Sphingomonas jaspsi]